MKADHLRGDVASISKTLKKLLKSNISAEEREALAELRRDDEITILPTKKGRMTVVMDTRTDEREAQALSNDSNTYVKLNSDPTQRYKAKRVALLKEWKGKNIISQPVWKKLYPTAEDVP